MLIQNIIGAAVTFLQNIFALQISLFLGHVGDITSMFVMKNRFTVSPDYVGGAEALPLNYDNTVVMWYPQFISG